MQINLIAAVGKNGEIGINGTLPWPKELGDLDVFRAVTTNSVVIVGLKTFTALRMLNNSLGRKFVADTFADDEINNVLNSFGNKRIWIAGGAKTYRKWAPLVNGRIVITYINWTGPADTYFPFDAYRDRIKFAP